MTESQGSAVGITTAHGLDRGIGVRVPVGTTIFSFSTASRTVLGPAQPPIRGVQEAVPMWVKRPGHEPDYSLPLTAEVKKTWIHRPLPVRHHGEVFN
jgi:hypothetical protein